MFAIKSFLFFSSILATIAAFVSVIGALRLLISNDRLLSSIFATGMIFLRSPFISSRIFTVPALKE